MSSNGRRLSLGHCRCGREIVRGRAAYERSCPFYKIVPGFSICVDAFRYGAIEGCKAYFLSHFHSDHYIGLTAGGTTAPYTAAKSRAVWSGSNWEQQTNGVVGLEFEEPYDIPGTDGATVTMIPANHCPGSSLFLFQKPLGRGPIVLSNAYYTAGTFAPAPPYRASIAEA